MNYMLSTLIMLIMVIIMVMLSVAFLTLFERKIMALYHCRKGPNKVSLMGILQPISDALKLINKETFYPYKSNLYIYTMSPMIMLTLIMLMWMIYPFMMNIMSFNLSVMFLISVMSTSVHTLMLMGWSSNSTYSMIGAIRSISQSISYEVTFTISMLMILSMINALTISNLFKFSFNNLLLFYPTAAIMLISMLAEINRTPFDLSEGESELVSGFNVEYGESKFTLIFLAEYASLMFMTMLFCILFIPTSMINIPLYLCMTMMIFIFTWIRMTLPRIRYDKLMSLCWCLLLPFILITYLMYLVYIKYPLDTLLIN